MNQYRQGDVFIQQCSKPNMENAIKQNDLVLAEGEVTGHAHRVVGKAVLLMVATKMYLECLERCHVVHEEHGSIELDPGYYEIRRQREFHAGMVRTVLD